MSTTHLRFTAVWAGTLFACACWACPAHAETATRVSSDAERAAIQAFERAEALLGRGDVSSACPLYEQSYALDPQLGVLLYWADCLERNGELVKARARFDEAHALAQSRGDRRATLAASRRHALEARLNRLRFEFRALPSRTRLVLNGEEIPASAWREPIFVEPAVHTIELVAEGRPVWKTTVRTFGDGKVHEVILPELPVAAARAERTPPPHARVEQRETTNRRVAATLCVGVGAVSLSTATVLLIGALDRYADSEPLCSRTGRCVPEGTRLRERASDLALGATIATGVGLAAFGGALALWLGGAETEKQERVETRGAFVPLPGGGSLVLERRF